MPTPTHVERPVDLMIDLRERMVRIETKLDIKADRDCEVDDLLVALALRTTALETEGAILKARVTTLKWLGAVAVTFVTVFGNSLSHLVAFLH